MEGGRGRVDIMGGGGEDSIGEQGERWGGKKAFISVVWNSCILLDTNLSGKV